MRPTQIDGRIIPSWVFCKGCMRLLTKRTMDSNRHNGKISNQRRHWLWAMVLGSRRHVGAWYSTNKLFCLRHRHRDPLSNPALPFDSVQTETNITTRKKAQMMTMGFTHLLASDLFLATHDDDDYDIPGVWLFEFDGSYTTNTTRRWTNAGKEMGFLLWWDDRWRGSRLCMLGSA